MRVLHVSPEVRTLNKVGGLGDVAFELPKALAELGGAETAVVAPLTGRAAELMEVGPRRGGPLFELCVPLDFRCHRVEVRRVELEPGPEIWAISSPLLDGKPVYPSSEAEGLTTTFPLLALSVLEGVSRGIWGEVDLIHVHDWPGAMVPLFARFHRYYGGLEWPPFVLSIHNMAHQGLYDPGVLDEWHLHGRVLSVEVGEFWGKLNVLKAGIVLSSCVLTVSPSYAEEIRNPEFGFGLDGVARSVGYKLFGILNGIDEGYWNPSTDPHIPFNYGPSDLEGKRRCKELLLEEMSLGPREGPLFCVVSRVVRQKGFDLLAQALPEMLASGVMVLVLGSGERELVDGIRSAARGFEDRFKLLETFDEALSRRIYAGSDFLLMPSLYEPCGVSQLIAMRYGTLPVARRVGGIRDTVVDVDEGGFGFLFQEYTVQALLGAFRRALSWYRERPKELELASRRAMTLDLSWRRAVDQYLYVYNLLRRR